MRAVCLIILATATASAQSIGPREMDEITPPNAEGFRTQQDVATSGHHIHALGGNREQELVKLIRLEPDVLQSGPQTELMPQMAQPNTATEPAMLGITAGPSQLGAGNLWHYRKIERLEFSNVKMLQQGRIQVVAHHDFNAPLLLKTASPPSDVADLEREVAAYRLLQGSGATPEFLGHVTEGGRAIGFIIEYIAETPSTTSSKSKQACFGALHRLHQRGVAHGDAHEGNCLVREDGSAVFIDFELSVEAASDGERERDRDILDRSIRALAAAASI